MDTINILGQEYKIILTNDEYDKALKGQAGYIDYKDKTIAVWLGAFRVDKVIRHEIVHAIFFEAGLHEYAYNETLVDAVAFHTANINKLAEEIEKHVDVQK